MNSLLPTCVGRLSTYRNNLLLPMKRLTTPVHVHVGLRCCCGTNVFNPPKPYTITRPAKLFGKQYYFPTADRPYFNSSCTSRQHSSITNLSISNISSDCYANQLGRRNITAWLLTRTCSKTGSGLLNGFGGRNFSVGRSASLTGSKGERGVNSRPPKQGNKLGYRTPREFMEQQGVKAGDYIKFLLQMTPLQENEQPNVFRGSPLYVHPNRQVAFGGCLMGQALSAAVCSVPQGQLIHSLHNYFLNAGRRGSIDYHVKAVRDGNTYCNRFVQGIQNGENIVNMQVSFKKDEVDPFHHQYVMPDCKKPEELVSASELLEKKLSEDLSEEVKKILRHRLPVDPVIEFRPVDEEAIYRLKPLPPKRLTWLKVIEKLGDDENFHRCALAFMSDYIIITTALLPNENSLQKFFLTSLDHSIWFHNNVRADEWLLYETESCHAGGGTGFATGRFWSQDGVLVASLAQQGVVRSLL